MLVSPARATASYRDHQFAATAGFFRSPMFDASLSNGVRYLIAARCNAIWSTSRAVAARLLRNGHPFVGRQCPICRTPLGAFSPVGHLITACTDPRIQAYRDTIGFSREFFVLLWQHAHEVAGLLPAPDVNSLDLSILVLGGTLCGGATLGNDWLAGFSQMGTVVAPPAGRVVHFLQRTMWSYSSSLWAYHRVTTCAHTSRGPKGPDKLNNPPPTPGAETAEDAPAAGHAAAPPQASPEAPSTAPQGSSHVFGSQPSRRAASSSSAGAKIQALSDAHAPAGEAPAADMAVDPPAALAPSAAAAFVATPVLGVDGRPVPNHSLDPEKRSASPVVIRLD
ncbi:hypothetical protein HK105_201385 [Polyrhizophydium stewartii]|uniref:Reverse transcriptase zinc-binding domain-containing protein n=1 Tax=Polyrhizophydium stewartii TaxID=2732419 RepID=A0ABR4NHW8_9FUNG